MLSEYENNLIQQSASSISERKSRKSSIFRQIGQTLNGRYGHKSGFSFTESAVCHQHPPNSTNPSGHGNRRISSIQRGARDHHPEANALKMVQIHESNVAEGRVWVPFECQIIHDLCLRQSLMMLNFSLSAILRYDLTHDQPIPNSSEVMSSRLNSCIGVKHYLCIF